MTDLLGGFLYLEVLRFSAQPLVVYLEGPAMVSVALPFLISCWIVLHVPVGERVASRWVSRRWILWLLFVVNLWISVRTAYWSARGLHFFSAGEIVWPLLVWFWGPKGFSPWWAYVLSFFGGWIPDFLLSGAYNHWKGDFWFGIGGAGWQDMMFLAPLTTGIAAWLVAGIWYGRRIGCNRWPSLARRN